VQKNTTPLQVAAVVAFMAVLAFFVWWFGV
jgi:hypothetical protein